jgi:hypothetical protein
MKEVVAPESGEWRFVFRSQDDDSRLLYMHVFAFNLYVKSQEIRQEYAR